MSGRTAHDTGRTLRGSFEASTAGTPGSIPILKSKKAEGQTRIQSQPDEYWIPKNWKAVLSNDTPYPEVDKMMKKAGYLLVTAGQDVGSARVTATASDHRYVGNSWMPVTGLSVQEAKAVTVFINSTAGRMQLMRVIGKKLAFPTYSTSAVNNIRIPDIKNPHILAILADCWEQTKDMAVPQFRDGECEMRRIWDEAVAGVMKWDADYMTHIRQLLHKEPHVRGLGYNQYGDAPYGPDA